MTETTVIETTTKTNTKNLAIAAITAIIGDIIVIPFYGFVLSLLWTWFMVPLGLPVVGLASAIGIVLGFQLLCGIEIEHIQDISPITLQVTIGHILARIGLALFVVLAGFVVHSF